MKRKRREKGSKRRKRRVHRKHVGERVGEREVCGQEGRREREVGEIKAII